MRNILSSQQIDCNLTAICLVGNSNNPPQRKEDTKGFLENDSKVDAKQTISWWVKTQKRKGYTLEQP